MPLPPLYPPSSPGWQPQSTGPSNAYIGRCNVFIRCWRDHIFRSMLGAMDIYALFSSIILVFNNNLDVAPRLLLPPPTVLSLALFGSPSSSVFPGLWPVCHCSATTSPCCPGPLKPFPDSISSLHLSAPLMLSGHRLCGLFWQQLSEPSRSFNGWVLPGSPVLFLLLPDTQILLFFLSP